MREPFVISILALEEISLPCCDLDQQCFPQHPAKRSNVLLDNSFFMLTRTDIKRSIHDASSFLPILSTQHCLLQASANYALLRPSKSSRSQEPVDHQPCPFAETMILPHKSPKMMEPHPQHLPTTTKMNQSLRLRNRYACSLNTYFSRTMAILERSPGIWLLKSRHLLLALL